MDTIHRFWTGPENDLFLWTEQTLKSLHPGVKIKTWTSGEYDVELGQVQTSDMVRHESNVIRYKALYDFGGIWLDHDVVPLCNLFNETQPNTTAGYGRQREGCFLRFDKGNTELKSLIDTIETEPLNEFGKSTHVSGAKALSRINEKVLIEPRVIPIDSFGNWIGKDKPIAVHLWATSRKRTHNIETIYT